MKDDHRKHRKLHPLSARRMGARAVLDKANRRTDLVRQRDAANATANSYDAARVKAARDIAAADRDPSADRSKLPAPGAVTMMAVNANIARAESQRLTREIATIPNIGRTVRRSFARRLAPAKVRPVYPLPEQRTIVVVAESKREQARRVRQMARGVVLST